MRTTRKNVWAVWAIASLCIFLAVEAKGERPDASNPYQFVAGNGQIPFGPGGAAYLPLSVLGGLKNGQLSPIMQFVLVNSMMTQCIKKTLKEVPARRDPFVVAKKKFDGGYCKIRKCFEQGMILSQLSQLSSNPNYGGSADAADRQGSQVTALALAQAFQKEDSCSGSGGQPIDAALIQIIGN